MNQDLARHLFVCDNAAVPPRLQDQPGLEQHRIASHGDSSELDLHIQDLGSVLRQVVNPRAADLVRLAAYVHRADTMVSRGDDRDVHGAHWKRELLMCVPVSDPEYWNGPSVKHRLRAALEFSTGDTWDFAFSLGESELNQLPLSVQEREILGQPRAVSLFSGGIDSLCALLESAANGERPVAVGHWSTGPHIARQRDLVRGAEQAHVGGWNFPLIGFEIHRKGEQWADNTLRTRAFLFASLGTAVAAEIGVERVYLPDNGPISLNLPINDQLVGTLASRSTHPKFLYLYNQFVSDLFPTKIAVSNPLANRTRAEALHVLIDTKCADLLPRTLSCSAWARMAAKTPHCGTCSQCIDRRVAAIAAGLAEYDPVSAYRTDVFIADLDHWKARATATSYVRFAAKVRSLDADQLFAEYPQLRDAVVPGNRDPGGTVAAATDLLRRHAEMVRTALRIAMAKHLDQYLDGALPPSCLLIIAGVDLPDAAESTDLRGSFRNDSGAALSADGGNQFVWVGEYWLLRYKGIELHLRKRVGLGILALLLKHKRRSFTAAEVEATLRPLGDIAPVDSASDEGLRVEHYGAGGTVVDAQALREYRAALTDLNEDLAEAERNHDSERYSLLKAEMDWYREQLAQAVKPGGGLETFTDNLSRQHDRVYQNLWRSIRLIRQANQAVGLHFEGSIQRSSDFTYAPEPDVVWEVRPPVA